MELSSCHELIEAWTDAHAARLERFFRSRRLWIDEPTDCVQLVFQKAFRHLKNGGDVPENETAWLNSIGRRVFLDAKRRQTRLSANLTTYATHLARDTGCEAITDEWALENTELEFSERLEAAVSELPVDLERIVQGKMRGYTNKELACQFGLHIRTVQRRLAEARKLIGTTLTRDVDDASERRCSMGA
jgi:RNA polymerase sigma factor (sigma-70 family)